MGLIMVDENCDRGQRRPDFQYYETFSLDTCGPSTTPDQRRTARCTSEKAQLVQRDIVDMGRGTQPLTARVDEDLQETSMPSLLAS